MAWVWVRAGMALTGYLVKKKKNFYNKKRDSNPGLHPHTVDEP